MARISEWNLYRRLVALAGVAYFLWWVAVEIFLPGSYNPLLGRLLVVGFALAVFGLSFWSDWVRDHLRILCTASTWLITLHYYYLFYCNAGEGNWIIGSYITVMAVSFFLFSNVALLSYSLFATALSVGIAFFIPALGHTVFLPGILTILLQANVGLRSRLSLMKSMEEKDQRATAMAESLRVRDEFISLASHELKTPITALKLQTEIIVRDLRGPRESSKSKIEGLLDLFKRQTDRLTELVDTMLDVSRISAGRLVLELQEVNLSALVQEVVASMRVSGRRTDSVEAPSITITGSERVVVRGDRPRIKQILENLIGNAVKYGQSKPIEVRVDSEGATASILVTDHGIGIAVENEEKIFERFERAASAQNISGLGLGLYIAQQIAKAHGGKISVASALGAGSTFTLRLPF